MSGVCAFAVAVEQTSTATARRPRTNDPPSSRIFILISSNRVSKNPVHSTLLLTLLHLSRQFNNLFSRLLRPHRQQDREIESLRDEFLEAPAALRGRPGYRMRSEER